LKTPDKTEKKRRVRGLSVEALRQLICAFPGVEEGPSFGTPGFRVRGKFLARVRDEGQTLAIKADFAARDVLMNADPETFYVTDHYRCYPMMLVRLATVRRDDLERIVEDAWRLIASRRQIAEYEGRRSSNLARSTSVSE
jgi:hypothetical protein